MPATPEERVYERTRQRSGWVCVCREICNGRSPQETHYYYCYYYCYCYCFYYYSYYNSGATTATTTTNNTSTTTTITINAPAIVFTSTPISIIITQLEKSLSCYE